MNQQDDLNPRGFFRKERDFLGDYRQRAAWIGKLQLTLSICYLVVVFLHNEFLSLSSSFLKPKFIYSVETENQTLGILEVTVQNPAIDAAFSKLYFWMVLNSIRAVFHIFSSVLLMWATRQSTAKIRAIWSCNCTRMMNLAFLLYEIVVFVFMYQEWEFAIFFVVYRIWFNHEVSEFLNTVKILSPKPPGYHC